MADIGVAIIGVGQIALYNPLQVDDVVACVLPAIELPPRAVGQQLVVRPR